MPHQRDYETAAIRVHWDSSRCIHTGVCLRTLPEVFDIRRRPWVDIEAAGAEKIADAVERCPTGALRYQRLDGAEGEEPQRPTIVAPIQDGPLMLIGDLDVRDADGEPITHETRLTLCRCGLSRNQPFCDNSHRRRGWKSGPTTSEPPTRLPPLDQDAPAGPTEIVAKRDASLELRGQLRIYHSGGQPLVEAGQALLCRCGHSRHKPFCDGSHHTAEFKSSPPEIPRDRLTADTPAAFTPNPRVPWRTAWMRCGTASRGCISPLCSISDPMWTLEAFARACHRLRISRSPGASGSGCTREEMGPPQCPMGRPRPFSEDIGWNDQRTGNLRKHRAGLRNR